MKKLILIRHAKSSWEFDVNDRERPIKYRGIRDIKLIAKAFKEHDLIPEKIFCSPARRARQTAELFITSVGLTDNELEIREELYDFSGHSVVDFLKNIPNSYQRIMIFGHNHAFTSISNIFGDKHIDNLPTAGLVVLKFDIYKWKNLNKGETKLTLFPRDFK